MYKLLLCWRYLRTRYIALASIISVTLGVATMIVVNSVMEGFTSEMQNRIHGILSDLVFESRDASTACPTPSGCRRNESAAWPATTSRPCRRRSWCRRCSTFSATARQITQQVQSDRHRREDAEQRERFRQVLAAPGEPRSR